MDHLIAFVAAAVTLRPNSNPDALPTFKPKFWFRRDRLDARPAAWSLRNRPEEWESGYEGMVLTHIPSQHRFWAHLGGYHLYDAPDCGCLPASRGYFQRFQKWGFHRAVIAWRRWDRARNGVDAEHFAGHFVTPRKTET